MMSSTAEAQMAAPSRPVAGFKNSAGFGLSYGVNNTRDAWFWGWTAEYSRQLGGHWFTAGSIMWDRETEDVANGPDVEVDTFTVAGTTRRLPLVLCFLGLLALVPSAAFADGAAEMQKKLQNPLANIKAIMTDNVIGFDTGNTDGTSYGFQLQPVYAVDFPDRGFTFINRAVIPIMGLEPGTDTRITGQPDPSETDSVWGLGDTVYQGFFAPHTDAGWKWGAGPQISLPTATDSRLEGSQWGAGVAGVLVGNFTEDLAFAGIIANQWGFDGNFNTMILQPMFFYAVAPGKSVAYNAVISSDWKADSSNQWTVPRAGSFASG